jgi:hypothetical protein
LWSVPLLLIAAIMLIVTLLPMGFGPVGLVVALFLVAWLQRRAEAYVRARDSQEP